MSEGDGVRGILLAHGAMAFGMADAVRKISGVDEEVLHPLSNDGKSPDILKAELDALIGDRSAVIFTDLASGSCAIAARVCSRGSLDRVVLFGVNLPILLDFVFNRHLPIHQLVPRLLEKGRQGLKSAPEIPTDADPPLSG